VASGAEFEAAKSVGSIEAQSAKAGKEVDTLGGLGRWRGTYKGGDQGRHWEIHGKEIGWRREFYKVSGMGVGVGGRQVGTQEFDSSGRALLREGPRTMIHVQFYFILLVYGGSSFKDISYT
jgi:hypothetical protein